MPSPVAPVAGCVHPFDLDVTKSSPFTIENRFTTRRNSPHLKNQGTISFISFMSLKVLKSFLI